MNIQAFEVPNSRIVIAFKQTQGYNASYNFQTLYRIEVMMKNSIKNKGCELVYAVYGTSKMKAAEKLFEAITKCSSKWEDLINLKPNEEIIVTESISELPYCENDDVRRTLSFILNNIHHAKDFNIDFLKAKDRVKYSARLSFEKGTYFYGLANGDKNIALQNLMKNIFAAGAYLEKLQEVVWNVFLDVEDSNSTIKVDMFGNKKIVNNV